MTLPAGSSLSRSIEVSVEAERVLKEKFGSSDIVRG